MAAICRDLWGELDELDQMVSSLPDPEWDTPTPAQGWSIRDQISHLAYFDDKAAQAATDPQSFIAWRDGEAMKELAREGETADVAMGRSMAPSELIQRWRSARAALLAALEKLDPKDRIPWFGPDMSAVSKATARLMEAWAHGQDVADALRIERVPTDHLRHVCHIGVRAMPWSYRVRKLDVPDEPVRVEVTSPGGELWTWGPDDATNIVRGTALDFALVVTQRRHRDDTALQADGPVADEWLSIAQAFAGPPGPGRKPGQFSTAQADSHGSGATMQPKPEPRE